MHDCDVMVAVGARFDDRVTGRLDAFSPGSKKIHIDIDPSSIGKVVRADVGILGDAGKVLEALMAAWKRERPTPDAGGWSPGGSRSPPGGPATACATTRQRPSSSRSTPSSGFTR